MRKALVVVLVLSLVGLIDAGYLAVKHFAGLLPTCEVGFLADCGVVLNGPYSTIFGVPVAALGVVFYSVVFASAASSIFGPGALGRKVILFFSTGGLLASIWFSYLQFFVIGSLCPYCLLSALLSTGIFLTSILGFARERVFWITRVMGVLYRNLLRPILFLVDSERVHGVATLAGEFLSGTPGERAVAFGLSEDDQKLRTEVGGINFRNPVGLAAGFDYEARLTGILPALGFGFQTVGTITNLPFEGNPKPRLARLPESRSLLVNKGFRNLGTTEAIKRLAGKKFAIPVGISVGTRESVADVIEALTKFEEANLGNSYYELNISCPNLAANISFYPPKNLRELLMAVDKLRIKRPVFVKMPISESDGAILAMLEVISNHDLKGVILGNLQKDRSHGAFVASEMAAVSHFKGNFSGRPTFDRSNELISLAYKRFGGKLVIIGCGGVFTAADAYEKVLRGASLVQLITGLVYQGPQLVAEIKLGLSELLKRDGFGTISEAVGSGQR